MVDEGLDRFIDDGEGLMIFENEEDYRNSAIRKFNENHDPATGRFTYGSGGSGGKPKTRGHLERDFSMNRAEGVKQIMADTGHDYGKALEDYQVLFGWCDSTTTCSTIRKAQRGALDGFRQKSFGKSGEILEQYIADAPQWDGGVLFRGVSGREMDKYYDHLQVGDIVDMGGASSWTSDPYSAASFAGHGAVFTWREPKNCTSISHISPHIGEGEVVASKRNVFSVSKIEDVGSKRIIMLENAEETR